MLRASRLMALMLLVVAHLDCYQSSFPMEATPSLPIDPALLRTWRCLPVHDDSAVMITVSRASASVYAVEFEAPGDPPEQYEAYATQVGKARVLNVRDPRAAKPWTFAKYELRGPNSLTISLLAEGGLPETLTTPAALRQALEGPAATYETLCHCRSIPRPSAPR